MNTENNKNENKASGKQEEHWMKAFCEDSLSDGRRPYTYLIGWSEHKIFYYGARFGINCEPNDLFVTYFTSSKYVKKFMSEHGKPDIIKIRKVFSTVSEYRKWEHKVLRRMKVIKRQDFLNRTDNISIAPQIGENNSSKREDVKQKIRESVIEWYKTHDNPMLGKKASEEARRRQSERCKGEGGSFWGRKHSEETKKLLSDQRKGIPNPNFKLSDEGRRKMTETHGGKPKNRVCCVLCHKEVTSNTLPSWHGPDKCDKKADL